MEEMPRLEKWTPSVILDAPLAPYLRPLPAPTPVLSSLLPYHRFQLGSAQSKGDPSATLMRETGPAFLSLPDDSYRNEAINRIFLNEEDIYSYAWQHLIPPAIAIRAKALLNESDDENIYEEIPYFFQQKALLLDVFRNSEKFGGRRNSNSPDSGLTASVSSDDICKPASAFSQGAALCKIKRCESLDMKGIVGRRPKDLRRGSGKGNQGVGKGNRDKYGFRKGIKVMKDKLQRRKWKFSSKKDKKSYTDLTDGNSDPGGVGLPSSEDLTFPSFCSSYEKLHETKLSSRDSRSSRSSRSSHSSNLSSPWTEERIYEDIHDIVSPSSGCQETEDAPWISRRLPTHRPISSSDSWGSEDFESYSSNEEDKPTPHTCDVAKSENLRDRIQKKREQWKERRQSSRGLKFSGKSDSKEKEVIEESKATLESSLGGESRLYRWLSVRKSNYEVEKQGTLSYGTERSSYTLANGGVPSMAHPMPRLLEEADQDSGAIFSERRGLCHMTMQRHHPPPTLPPMPPDLSVDQIKRRHIVASIVHTENNYVAALQRLVNDYKKPLEESKPPIISEAKQKLLFYRLSEILQCHALFRIALRDCVRLWDQEEKLGEVFVASFSKAAVLDVYSDFINNFSTAIDIARQEAKKKSAFADFLKMRQITSSDRLSLFGLMVKPVQRFPQFILFLQDLLKCTVHGHHDRMSLQLALTQLESLAEMLNERKREAEQYQAFRDSLKRINTKFALKNLSNPNRYLLRQDNVIQLELNPSGSLSKKKHRKLLMTNDLVICVSFVPKASDEFFNNSERLSLKWAHSVADIEIIDCNSSPTLNRLLVPGATKSSFAKSPIPAGGTLGYNNVDGLVQEMNNLMHDYEILSRIAALASTMKGSYEELNETLLKKVGAQIQLSIRQKDEQMIWIDSCCLQFSVKAKDGKEKETFTFQTENPAIKKDWTIELRLAQLAVDKTNCPAWDLRDQDRVPSTKMPLFVASLPAFSSQHQTEVKCGCCYVVAANRPTHNDTQQLTYLWLCSSNGISSHLTIFTMQQVELRELERVDLTELQVTALHHVPANAFDSNLPSPTVWIGTESRRILVYNGLEPQKQILLSSASVTAAITTIKYYCDQVFVGLRNGSLNVYHRGNNGDWMLKDPIVLSLSTLPVLSLLAISTHVYASCENKVHVIDCFTVQTVREFSVQHDGNKSINLMAHSGIGLWIAQTESSCIGLYHMETFRHLQNINIASNVNRMLSETGNTKSPAKIFVTSLLASKGLLWVGTNVGVVLTIPLPRLEGVPIISGRANVSFHSHIGSVTFLLALQTQPDYFNPDPKNQKVSSEEISSKLEKQEGEATLVPGKVHLKGKTRSPVLLRRDRSQGPREQQTRRLSKTLPRGVGSFSLSRSQECDMYGLCGALLNVEKYVEDSFEPSDRNSSSLFRSESMRRSDPELAGPLQASTLDRRVRLKASRPHSLDLSMWSMDSIVSSACTTSSSGSEETSRSKISDTSELVHSPYRNRKSRRKDDQNRTLMVVTGGRGYINWQRSDANARKPSLPNTNDAYIVVWEMKV